MAQITVGTAKNAVMILKINNLYLADVSQNAYMRGHYRFEYIDDSEEGPFCNLFVDSTQLATYPNNATYVRITLNDSSIKADGFATQPPVTGGTPTFTVSAPPDSNYLTSGAWTYDNSYYTFVSFTDPDAGFSVSYDSNGGTGTAPATQLGASSYTVSANTFSRTGYVFNGWNTAADGSGTSYAAGSTITPTANTTLYAQWAIRVIYNANGGSVTPSSALYANTALLLPTPIRSGYGFNGWYTAATGGTLVTSPYTPTAGTTDITIYAQWTKFDGISIYLNGTTGAQDGTKEITGDGTGIELGEIGSVAIFHIRAATGQTNNESVTVTAPLDCQVSKNGVDYFPSITYVTSEIKSLNIPCYVKRVAMTQTSTGQVAEKLSTTPHCPYVTMTYDFPTYGTVLFTDNFTRANSTTVGNSWEQTTNGTLTSYGIVNNALAARSADTADASLYIRRAYTLNNHAVEAKIVQMQAGATTSTATLFLLNGNGWSEYSGVAGYYLNITPTGSLSLYKITGGVPLDSAPAGTIAEGDRIAFGKLSTGGIAVWKNGVPLLYADDTSTTSFTYLSIRLYAKGGSVDSSIIDDVKILGSV